MVKDVLIGVIILLQDVLNMCQKNLSSVGPTIVASESLQRPCFLNRAKTEQN